MALSAEQRATLQKEVNQINLKPDAQKTEEDYRKIAALNNWATAYAPNYGYNGNTSMARGNYAGVGAILGDGGKAMKDMDAMTADAGRYNYDVRLDPRNNTGAGSAINDLLQNAQLRANQDAIAGNGTYDDNLQKYYAQIGYTGDINDIYTNLQQNKTLGLTDFNGRSIEEAYGLGNYDGSGIKWEYDPSFDIGSQAWQDRIDRQREEEQAYLATLPQYQGAGLYDGDISRFNYNGTALNPASVQARESGTMSPIDRSVDGILGNMMYDKSMSGQNGSNPWGYDLESDPVWQAYQKQYNRQGQQAMNDSMAQLAARTGGMASSYAGQVGQQAYDSYMQEMTDKIPELEQNAYSRYMDDQNLQLQQAQLDLQKQQLALQQQAQDWSQQQSASSAAAAQQSDNYSNLLTLMSKYGYQPSDQELAAAGMSGNLRDAVLQLGQYAPQQASATGYNPGGTGYPVIDNSGNNPSSQISDTALANMTKTNGFNHAMELAKAIQQRGGNVSDVIQSARNQNQIDDIQAIYLLKYFGLA